MNMLEKAKQAGVEGYLLAKEADFLAKTATGKKCLEVGSFRGLSAFCTAGTAESLLCVDTFKAGGGGQAQEDSFTTLDDFKAATSSFTNVTYIAKPSTEAAKDVDELFDFIFIDAMHTYGHVKLDIEAWLPKLKQDGMMAFHDHCPGFPGVIQAVKEKFGKIDGSVDSIAWIIKR